MPAPARTGPQRTFDTFAKLEAVGGDCWVATASAAGVAHLIPLSYGWDGECVVLAAPADSLTVRNLRASERARLGFGPTRDVAIFDCELDRIVDASDPTAQATAGAYVDQAAWDPRVEVEPYVFALLRPSRVQAWRESNELAGKLLMRGGDWFFGS